MMGVKNQETMERRSRWKSWKKEARNQRSLLILSVPFFLYGFVFCYLPLAGWAIAFQDFRPRDGIFGSKYVGLKVFRQLFEDQSFWLTIRNTIAMSLLNLLFSTFMAILFAILLNEVRWMIAKKFVQTVSYLPHFLSWIVTCGILLDMLGSNGIVNDLLMRMHAVSAPLNFFAYPELFWWIVAFAVVWKETGWNAIIYLAAITSIDPNLYEAASIDGGGRWVKMRYVTLPGIANTIVILLILNIGNVLNSGFEVQYLLGNDVVRSFSQTIDIYVLKWGISQSNYAVGTAAGIFKSAVSIVLILITNEIAKRTSDTRLF